MNRHCISIPGDVSKQEGIASLVAEISKRESKLDILVNNAGAAWGAEFDEFPESGWDKTVDLNMKTPFFLTQALAPLLRAASSKDRLAKVINMNDGAVVNGLDTHLVFETASKSFTFLEQLIYDQSLVLQVSLTSKLSDEVTEVTTSFTVTFEEKMREVFQPENRAPLF